MCTPFFFPSHHPLTNTLNFDTDPDITPPNVTVQLAGSLVRYAGRVEVYTLGYWGTVCDDAFDLTDANIVCRELGYSGALVVSFFGQGGGVIALDEVACEGDETSILQCPHNGLFNHDCIHSEDVGVVCNVGGKMAMYPSEQIPLNSSCEDVPPDTKPCSLDLLFDREMWVNASLGPRPPPFLFFSLHSV